MATGGGASPENNGDDVVEYEEAFEMLEKYSIISTSGSDRDGHPVIVISACRLPPSDTIDHNVLLRYGKYVLDKIVEEKYTVVYCHYGLTSTNKPSFSWLRQVYGEMDRKYKKNIQKVYVLHPTLFVRFILSLMKPFLNYKFGRKLSYINRLEELEHVLNLEELDIPDEVKQYDITLSPVRHVATNVHDVTTNVNDVTTDVTTNGHDVAANNSNSHTRGGEEKEEKTSADLTVPPSITQLEAREEKALDVPEVHDPPSIDINSHTPFPPDGEEKTPSPSPPDGEEKTPSPSPPDGEEKTPSPPDGEEKTPSPSPPDGEEKTPSPPDGDEKTPSPPDGEEKTPSPSPPDGEEKRDEPSADQAADNEEEKKDKSSADKAVPALRTPFGVTLENGKNGDGGDASRHLAIHSELQALFQRKKSADSPSDQSPMRPGHAVKKPPPVAPKRRVPLASTSPPIANRKHRLIEEPSSFHDPTRTSGLPSLASNFPRPRGPQGRHLPSRFFK